MLPLMLLLLKLRTVLSCSGWPANKALTSWHILAQVVLTTIEPSKHRPELSYDAYEYTVRHFALKISTTAVIDTLGACCGVICVRGGL